jgi:hypothetical protein
MLSELRVASLPQPALQQASEVRPRGVLIYGCRSEGFICTYDPRRQLLTVEIAVIDGRLFGADPAA